jgi:hypothetical protein
MRRKYQTPADRYGKHVGLVSFPPARAVVTAIRIPLSTKDRSGSLYRRIDADRSQRLPGNLGAGRLTKRKKSYPFVRGIPTKGLCRHQAGYEKQGKLSTAIRKLVAHPSQRAAWDRSRTRPAPCTRAKLLVDENGIALRGLILRHLVLPGNIRGTDKFVQFGLLG